jgi:2-polyprenyl-3-methyl-5-hydroxy-6-metoxy-1,4-benzoquinol methylase
MISLKKYGREITHPTRNTNDFVGQEGFRRREIDRPFVIVNDGYARAFNRATAPLTVARKIARSTGQLAILDVGCGTGRTLFDFVAAVRNAGVCPPEMVRGVGVTLHDYSGESTEPGVAGAIASGEIDYRVGPAEQMRRGDSSTYDIVISHELLRHVRNHRQVLEQMRSAAGREGAIYLTTQFHNGQPAPWPVAETFAEWQGYGHTVLTQPGVEVCPTPNKTFLGTSANNVVLPLDRQ